MWPTRWPRFDRRERLALLLRALRLRHRADRVERLHIAIRETEVDCPAGRIAQAGHAAAERGLAAAAFADEAERLAAAEIEAHAVDGAHMADDALQRAFLDRKVLFETAHGEHLPGRLYRRGGAAAVEGERHRVRSAKLGRRPAAPGGGWWMKQATS